MTHADRSYPEGAPALTDHLALSPLAAAMSFSTLVMITMLLVRGPLPIDETRYLTVAWEMWRSGDLVVPHLNGEPYSHKPPMMFWLINGAWALVGPQEWAARAVPAAFLPLSVFLTYRLGAELGGRILGGHAALTLASMVVFAAYGSAMLFDAMLTAATVAGLIGLVRAARGQAVSGWLIFAASISFGLLSKGPVILLHLIPAALLAPLWAPSPVRWFRWYAFVLLAIAAGIVLPLLWAMRAAEAGGPEFGGALLWQQTAGRVVDSFAHKRPFWFYLPLLPVLIFPWIFSARLWTRRQAIPLWQDAGNWRLPVIMIAVSLLALSLISGKQLHYMLPLMPAAALLIARKITADEARPVEENAFPFLVVIIGLTLLFAEHATQFSPVSMSLHDGPGLMLVASGALMWWIRKSTWQVIPSSAALIVFALLWQCHLGALAAYDLRPVAALIEPSKPVAFVGNYHGEIGFVARLTRPVDVVEAGEAAAWREAHRDGTLIARYKGSRPDFADAPALDQPYRGRRLGVWAPLGPQ
jgi:4-amino-4-deoxy-L-arabinose transferase-like glycosyltransferase